MKIRVGRWVTVLLYTCMSTLWTWWATHGGAPRIACAILAALCAAGAGLWLISPRAAAEPVIDTRKSDDL